MKDFARAFAESLAQAHPLEFVATVSKAQRNGKIHADYLRNSRGATSVASYSLRARRRTSRHAAALKRAGCLRSVHDFDIKSAPRRLARLGADPWKGIATVQ